MKASLQWMKDYVSVNIGENPQEFADTLTQAGIPVEEVIQKIHNGEITDAKTIIAVQYAALHQ